MASVEEVFIMGKSSSRKKAKRQRPVFLDNFIDPGKLQTLFMDQDSLELLTGQPRDAWVNEKPNFSPMLRMRMKTLVQYEQLVQAGRERVAQIEEEAQADV
jgi:hypothetical protein